MISQRLSMIRLLMAALGMTCLFCVAYAAEPEPAEPPAQEAVKPPAEASRQRPAARQRPRGFGTREDTIRKDYADSPSIVEGQPAGIKAGKYPADFQLEPVEIYPQFAEWLGSQAPASFEDEVMLADLVGKQPVMLLFGSYT